MRRPDQQVRDLRGTQESEGARARGKKSSEVFRGVVETFRGGDAQLQT